MLSLVIPEREVFVEATDSFVTVKSTVLRLEHSLVSISKWESVWKKPFLVKDPPKTREESIDYIRCMTISQNVDPMVYYSLGPSEVKQVNEYIDSNLSATVVKRPPQTRASTQIVTSELIYAWMVGYRIPFECQKWHLSRLLALIDICDIHNNPGKKMSKREILAQNHALNAARRAKLHTKG